MTSCPKCGKTVEAAARICMACGVILSKARANPAPGAGRFSVRPAPPEAPAGDEGHASPFRATLKFGLAAAAGLAALVTFNRIQAGPSPAAAPATRSAPRIPIAAPVPAAPAPANENAMPSLSREDVAFLNELSARLGRSPGTAPTDAEVDRVEKLLALNRENEHLQTLMRGLYARRADHDFKLGAFARVEQTLGRMKLLDDRQPEIYALETQVRARQDDWSGALAAVQKYEGISGEATVAMSYMLALSFEKLGRRPDALAVLDRPIFQSCDAMTAPSEASACSAVRQMRQAFLAPAPPSTGTTVVERPRKALDVDPSKEQIQSQRFDVRFDGESQSGVARDVLFVLDRAYVRLADVYYDRPARRIPVVLHSGQDYYTKTGAPWWSGGVYSSHDGGIQIPVRGLPKTLPAEMEDVLVHELSHAFVDEMSGGLAGRDLQEGLAQYMEGKRIEQELGPAELKRLANAGGRGVMPFYMLSLAVSQQLVQSRGQGRVNELLKAMKETGSEDAGFRKVFGQSGTDMRKDILATFWRRYS